MSAPTPHVVELRDINLSFDEKKVLEGVSLGLGEVGVSWGAAGVLGVNVALLLLSGTATLAVQRWLVDLRSGATTT